MIATSNEREKAENISQGRAVDNLHCDAIKKRNAGREMSSSQKKEE